MSKIAVIGDIHLKSTEKYGRYIPKLGLDTRTRDKLSIVDYAVKKSLEEDVSHIFFAGDIFDSLTPSERLRSMFFRKLKDAISEKKVYLIIGNHDTNLVSMHTLLTVQEINHHNIVVVDGIEELEIDSRKISICSYGYEDALYQKMNKTQGVYCDILLGHMRIDPYFRDSILTEEFIERMAHITRNGHYHTAGPLHVGALAVNNRSEIGNDTGFEIIDLDSMSIERYRTPERRFIKIDSSVDGLEKVDVECDKNTIISVKLVDTSANLEKVNIHSVKQFFKGAGKVTVDKEQILSQKEHVKTTIELHDANVDDDIERYAKSINRTDMIENGKEIHRKALDGIK